MAQATGVTLHLSDEAFELLVTIAKTVETDPEYRLMVAMKALATAMGEAPKTPSLNASEEMVAAIRQAAAERAAKEQRQ